MPQFSFELKLNLSYVPHALVIIFIALFTFPEFEPIVATGLDSSYVFAFNYFFQHKIPHGSDVIFAHGPLAFLRFPLLIGNNYFIAFALTLFIQLLFLSLLFLAVSELKKWGLLRFTILAILLSANLRIDEKIIACVAFSLLLYSQMRNATFLINAVVITAFSFFVKLNIAAASVMMILSFLFYDAVKNKQFLNIFLSAMLGFSLYFALWALIYGSSEGVFLHLRNWFFISNGNLGATSINANNNKLLLLLLFLLLVFYRWKFNNEAVKSAYVIFAFALWAVFRYSIAREENYHAKAFFNFLILFSTVLFICHEKAKALQIAVLIAIPWLYYENMHRTEKYELETKLKCGGLTNFYQTLRLFKPEGQEYFHHASRENLAAVTLSDSAKKIIANRTVDIFPWETSYVAANNLNFKNRPLFQLGCVNNAVLDKVNAEFLLSGEAPELMIWTKQNWWGKEMHSIDNRYILSDDGQTIFQLLNRYSQIYEDEKIRILKRTEKSKLSIEKIQGTEKFTWNEWTEIPQPEQGSALRVKFVITKTILGKAKHFLYKEPEYHINYLLENDSIITHRLVVQNSESGIWLAPYLLNYNNSLAGIKVKAVKFVYTDHSWVYEPEFSVEWEEIKLMRK